LREVGRLEESGEFCQLALFLFAYPYSLDFFCPEGGTDPFDPPLLVSLEEYAPSRCYYPSTRRIPLYKRRDSALSSVRYTKPAALIYYYQKK
jgi:hypothetical protein